MKTVTALIAVGEKSADVISDMLSHFPDGHRVRVALTDENAPTGTNPDLVKHLLACPEKGWFEPMDRTETTDDLRSSPVE